MCAFEAGFSRDIAGEKDGFIFFGRTFAVDPGHGGHISHKVNHSRKRANAVATQGRAQDGPCIVLSAKRVKSAFHLAKPFV